MTTTERACKRETMADVRGRAIIVTLCPTYLTVRLKKTRQEMQLEYRAVYDCAAKLLARQAREEKMAKRRGR